MKQTRMVLSRRLMDGTSIQQSYSLRPLKSDSDVLTEEQLMELLLDTEMQANAGSVYNSRGPVRVWIQ